jgi:hypothetical protein
MPVQSCTLNGKPGFQYAPSGECHTYNNETDLKGKVRAHMKAAEDGHKILDKQDKKKGKGKKDSPATAKGKNPPDKFQKGKKVDAQTPPFYTGSTDQHFSQGVSDTPPESY